jgi:hypothetical protein
VNDDLSPRAIGNAAGGFAPTYALRVEEIGRAPANWPGYVVLGVLVYAVVLVAIFPGFALVGVVIPGFWVAGVSLPAVASVGAGLGALGRAVRAAGAWRRTLMLSVAVLAGAETFAFVVALLQIRHWHRP